MVGVRIKPLGNVEIDIDRRFGGDRPFAAVNEADGFALSEAHHVLGAQKRRGLHRQAFAGGVERRDFFLAVAVHLREIFGGFEVFRVERNDRAGAGEKLLIFRRIKVLQLAEVLKDHHELNGISTRRRQRLRNFGKSAQIRKLIEEKKDRRQNNAAGWWICVKAPQGEAYENADHFA